MIVFACPDFYGDKRVSLSRNLHIWLHAGIVATLAEDRFQITA